MIEPPEQSTRSTLIGKSSVHLAQFTRLARVGVGMRLRPALEFIELRSRGFRQGYPNIASHKRRLYDLATKRVGSKFLVDR